MASFDARETSFSQAVTASISASRRRMARSFTARSPSRVSSILVANESGGDSESLAAAVLMARVVAMRRRAALVI